MGFRSPSRTYEVTRVRIGVRVRVRVRVGVGVGVGVRIRIRCWVVVRAKDRGIVTIRC